MMLSFSLSQYSLLIYFWHFFYFSSSSTRSIGCKLAQKYTRHNFSRPTVDSQNCAWNKLVDVLVVMDCSLSLLLIEDMTRCGWPLYRSSTVWSRECAYRSTYHFSCPCSLLSVYYPQLILVNYFLFVILYLLMFLSFSSLHGLCPITVYNPQYYHVFYFIFWTFLLSMYTVKFINNNNK